MPLSRQRQYIFDFAHSDSRPTVTFSLPQREYFLGNSARRKLDHFRFRTPRKIPFSLQLSEYVRGCGILSVIENILEYPGHTKHNNN